MRLPLALALSLLSTLAFAAEPATYGLIFDTESPGDHYASPSHCDLQSTLRIQSGSEITGPIDVGVKSATAAIHLDAGATLKGPITISVCDGKVEISVEDTK